MADQKAVHSIEFPSDYVIGKGVQIKFSYPVWFCEKITEGKETVVTPTSKVMEKFRKEMSTEEFAEEQNRRTITFILKLEDFTVAELIAQHSGQTTLVKRFYNNNLSTASGISKEEAEVMIEKAGSKKVIELSKTDVEPKGRSIVNLQEKDAEKLTKEMEAMKAKMAKYEAELNRRSKEL